MEALNLRKGAGYSIEAVLASVILFSFAFGAVSDPAEQNWGEFQNSLAARDISFTMYKTGVLDTFLKNSNPAAIRTYAQVISSRDLRVSGTVRNLPLSQIDVGFHTMPGLIHENQTLEVTAGDQCFGDLTEIEGRSEYPVLRTTGNPGSLEVKHGVRLYFGDNDPQISGYNGVMDYDSIWVDNGSTCVFSPEEGPYSLGEIFLWGNTTDPQPETYYDFKNFLNDTKNFVVYQADKAVSVKKALGNPVAGMQTETYVNTFNFSSTGITSYDVIVFKRNDSLQKIEDHRAEFRDFLGTGSVLLMMNLTKNDLDYSFMEDIGFEWFGVPYSSTPSNYKATFSNYLVSQEVKTYFNGQGGAASDLTLKPGGKVISARSSTLTSREDLLYARNLVYETDTLDGTDTGWSDAGAMCSSSYSDTSSLFDFPDGNYQVINDNLAETSSECSEDRRGLLIDVDGDGNYRGPYLRNEVLVINGKRYVPRIKDKNTARFEFAGSRKVELVNHRRVLENITGKRVARIAYESNYSKADMKLVASVIYWLRGDEVEFRSGGLSSPVNTGIVGGIEGNGVFIPYEVSLRWDR
ncbi:MAG: hypothetical protein ABEJ36_05200 [Candidatus Nanosalina sp.]